VDLRIPVQTSDLSLCIEKPYLVFEWDDLVPAPLYQQLAAEFPGAPGTPGYKAQEAGKLFVNDRQGAFQQLIRDSALWQDFYRSWHRQDVIERIQQLVQPYIGHRAAEEQRPWQLVDSTDRHPSSLKERIAKKYHEKIRGRKTVRLGFEFSVLPDGAAVPLHTDAAFKLVSLLYYFPDPDWETQWGGGTCFYKVKDGYTPWQLWKSYYLDKAEEARFYNEHELITETAFAPNRISGFVKTDNSWHEVKPLRLPEGRLRRSLCINIFAW
jgi:hypothetical protein